MIENGIHKDIGYEDYHAIDRVSNSYLSRLLVCPAAAKLPPKEDTAEMAVGRAFHLFILEGIAAFEAGCAILPQINRRTNAGKEEEALFRDIHKGKAIITQEDFDNIRAMEKAIYNHPVAADLLISTSTEVTVLWDDPFSGIPCKARPDMLPGKNTLVDLKTTRDASARGFQRAAVTYGYHRQAAFYLDGVSKEMNEKHDVFAFVCVEKTEPYRVGVYTLAEPFIDMGRAEYRSLILVEQRCRLNNAWPNYNDNGAVEIEMPKWAVYREDV